MVSEYIKFVLMSIYYNLYYKTRLNYSWKSFKKYVNLVVKENNLKILQKYDYGVLENYAGEIDVFDSEYEYVGTFKNHFKLAKWIEENLI